MPDFAPDLVAFGDTTGYGAFDLSHYREHVQFVQILSGLVAPIIIPDYPLSSFLGAPQSARPQLLGLHQTAHDLLRSATGVTGIDLSELDLDGGQGFDDWLNFHRQEHMQIRTVLGLT